MRELRQGVPADKARAEVLQRQMQSRVVSLARQGASGGRYAEKDPAFESRQSAGAVIGIGSTRLYQIERGIRLPHEDEVIVMAKEYNAPELIEYYCKHVCAISAYCHKDK